MRIPEQIWNKMQTSTCYQISFTTEGLKNLQDVYKKIQGQPAFNHLLFKLDPNSRYYQAVYTNPELFKFIDFDQNTKTLYRPNGPCCVNLDELAKNPQKARNTYDGFSAIAWFVHPDQVEAKAILNIKTAAMAPPIAPPDLSNALKRTNSQTAIDHLDGKYYASLLDLSKEDIPYLKHLGDNMQEYLAANYDVDSADEVDLYFHFPYHPNTVTLHLHARVNQGNHPLEQAGRFYLKDVIGDLEKGKTIQEIIRAKQHLVNTEMGAYLKDLNLEGVTVKEIKNPHFINVQATLDQHSMKTGLPFATEPSAQQNQRHPINNRT